MENHALSLRGLRKTFGTLVAVDSLDLDIGHGEIFGFLGPNGAGKTTAIGMMTGLVTPDSGTVRFQGGDLTTDPQLRRKVGLCPQSLVLWERLTCLEQLIFVGRLYRLRTAEARQRGLALLADLGIEAKAHAQARTLSGGMQRRLNIALALVNDPDLVVFDEPEAGLDPQSRALVRDYIRSMAGRRTVIVTTHNMDEAERMADRVAILDQGKLLVLDTPQALRDRWCDDGRPAPDLEYVFLKLTGRRLRD